MRRRKRIEPTDDWDQLVPLFEWPEQKEYEEIRPLVLFGSSVAERTRVTGTSERTMYRKVERFENEGPQGLFSAEGAKRQLLPRAIRRMIVDLKAEHPAFLVAYYHLHVLGHVLYLLWIRSMRWVSFPVRSRSARSTRPVPCALAYQSSSGFMMVSTASPVSPVPSSMRTRYLDRRPHCMTRS